MSGIIKRIIKNIHQRIFTLFPQFISTFDMNHYAALTHYLIAKNYQVAFDDGLKLIATKDQNQITAEFDHLSRLTKLNG